MQAFFFPFLKDTPPFEICLDQYDVMMITNLFTEQSFRSNTKTRIENLFSKPKIQLRDPGTSPPPSSVRRLSTDVDECKKSLTDIRFLCGDDDYYYDHISTAILARSHKIQFTASFVTVKLAGNKGRQSLKYRLARYFFYILCPLSK